MDPREQTDTNARPPEDRCLRSHLHAVERLVIGLSRRPLAVVLVDQIPVRTLTGPDPGQLCEVARRAAQIWTQGPSRMAIGVLLASWTDACVPATSGGPIRLAELWQLGGDRGFELVRPAPSLTGVATGARWCSIVPAQP